MGGARARRAAARGVALRDSTTGLCNLPTLLCAWASADGMPRHKPPQLPTTLYFHDADEHALVAFETTPRFSTPKCGTGRRQSCGRCASLFDVPCRNSTVEDLRAVQAVIRRRLDARLWGRSAPRRTCAVVGSSAALLEHSLGDEIDRADIVVRINLAPTRRFEQHVGSRTTVRVWGATTDPSAIESIRKQIGVRAAEALNIGNTSITTLLRYCPPTGFLNECWRRAANDGLPRFHPSAWRLAQRQLLSNTTRCKRIGCFPSTGAMALLFARSACTRVIVYGFGVSGEGGVAAAPVGDGHGACNGRSGDTSVGRRQCAKSRARECEKYYQCAMGPYYNGPSQRVDRLVDGVALSHYWAGLARYHDMLQEWEWMRKLHDDGAIVWRGAGDPRAALSDPCYRRRMNCWKNWTQTTAAAMQWRADEVPSR